MSTGLQAELAAFTDERLMQSLCAATDRDASDAAFQEVFSRYHQRVVTWCYRVTKDRDTASDLAQEVFFKAYRHRDSFRGESRLSTWLYSITRNHCLSAIKRREDETVPLDPVVHRGLRDESGIHPSVAAERGELCRRMLSLMKRTLEPIEVRIMTLHYGHDIPLAVITRQLSLTNPSGAKAYIVNARRKLSGIGKRRGWDVVSPIPTFELTSGKPKLRPSYGYRNSNGA